jgi:RNA ligase (TIGR02306 family)
MERKLATIRKIAHITPIEGADAIEAVRIDGWVCVAKKGEFRVGDLCVYFEIDSLLPVRPMFDFLAKQGTKKLEDGSEGYRLKTIKLRGQISQGLALPIHLFVEGWETRREGDDVTEVLGVKKWEPPIPAQLRGQIKGLFPSFIRRTDQERIQNLPEWVTRHRGVRFEVTIKLDGSSMTVYHNAGEVGVCSRNLDLKEDETNSFWKVANRHNIHGHLKALGFNLAIQGELMGEGVQDNHEKLIGQDFYVYDIWDIDRQCYLENRERYGILEALRSQGCDLKHVPVVHESISAFETWTIMEDVLEAANGPSLNNPIREGLVFKSIEPVNGEVISFKVISNQFLLARKK